MAGRVGVGVRPGGVWVSGLRGGLVVGWGSWVDVGDERELEIRSSLLLFAFHGVWLVIWGVSVMGLVAPVI